LKRMSFRSLDLSDKKLEFDLMESARTVCLDLDWRVPVPGGKTNGVRPD